MCSGYRNIYEKINIFTSSQSMMNCFVFILLKVQSLIYWSAQNRTPICEVHVSNYSVKSMVYVRQVMRCCNQRYTPPVWILLRTIPAGGNLLLRWESKTGYTVVCRHIFIRAHNAENRPYLRRKYPPIYPGITAWIKQHVLPINRQHSQCDVFTTY